MRELFEEQLLLLNQELTEMGALCEEIISLASQALVSYDKALGEKVSKVGAKIDEEERTIETICMRLLLRQQPVARDLRAVSAALKMITDMERIGDQAEDIVEIIPCMIAHPHEEYPKIREMAKETIAMVTDSVDAYVKQDVYLAKAVQMHDDVVDNYFTRIKSGLIDMIAKNPAEGEYALDLLMIANTLSASATMPRTSPSGWSFPSPAAIMQFLHKAVMIPFVNEQKSAVFVSENSGFFTYLHLFPGFLPGWRADRRMSPGAWIHPAAAPTGGISPSSRRRSVPPTGRAAS